MTAASLPMRQLAVAFAEVAVQQHAGTFPLAGRHYRMASSALRRSVTSMQPGLWVMATGGAARSRATCGVTPQAQNRGSSPSATVTADRRSPARRDPRCRSRAGSPRCTGAPCTSGKRVQIWMARIASAAREGPHADDHVRGKGPRGRAGYAAVHGHVDTLGDVAHLEPGGDERFLEGKGAAEGEGDEVVPPQRADVMTFLFQAAVAENAIGGQVATQVDITELRQARVAGRRVHGKKRAGTRIGLAEAQKIMRPGSGQDHEVALHEAGSEPGGIAREFAAACHRAQFRRTEHCGVYGSSPCRVWGVKKIQRGPVPLPKRTPAAPVRPVLRGRTLPIVPKDGPVL
jgi:hypothetical protein